MTPLDAALGEMRANAGEIGGNNKGPFVRKYLNGVVAEGSPWCAAFTSWCLQQGGVKIPYTVGARDLMAACKAKGWLLDITAPLLPGDLAFWWRGAKDGWQGHVGFVLSETGGVVTTIEGNRTPNVQPFVYRRDQLAVPDQFGGLLGFARPGGIAVKAPSRARALLTQLDAAIAELETV